jgi:hypothetical protein
LDDGEVSLGDGLEEPLFLEKFGIFRMPNIWQVGMKYQIEVTEGHSD